MSLAAAIDSVAPEARQLALEIHALAETAREERRSAGACADYLERLGFSVRWGDGHLDTAFRAEIHSGKPGPRVALLAEYDALPELGHACGHNLIAGACVAAGGAVALAGLPAGSLVVFGTPAEEIGFGKPAMLAEGWFDDVDVALSIHPFEACTVLRSTTALRAVTYSFEGAAAHASEPWNGHNALDAVLALFSSSHALRTRSRENERVHGIVLEGGTAYNVVPEYASARLGIRAGTVERADALTRALDAAAAGAALASETQLTASDRVTMEPLRWEPVLAELVEDCARAAGLRPQPPRELSASTDVGNVSQAIPTALLMIDAWPPGTGFHTPEAAIASAADSGLDRMCDGGSALAHTVVELLAA